jgi:cyclopropane-fatty-acyl-phospholipid synthase
MQALLNAIGRQFRNGSLEFVAADGRRWTIGQGEPSARVALHDPPALRRILLNPQLALGETYMEGAWDPEDGRLLPVLMTGVHMLSSVHESALSRSWHRLRNLAAELNTPQRSRHNVSRHYDLDYDLYRQFLDADLHYSCAYFRDPGMDLEAAQQAKCAHIAAKLDLKPGARVLDIGCGWGSLAMYLAERFEAQVVGITLSEEQLRVARERARSRGLEGRVEFRLEDYRQTDGKFDAIASVGMFEHVGRPQYRNFFQRVHELLEPTGVALLHTIGRTSPPGSTNAWVRKYIFPGGYIPAASETLEAVEKVGLLLTDLEVWRLHYARTLAAWNERFQSARAQISSRMGERFCRMWEFYLQGSEASFRCGDLVVFHLQITAQRERLPLTRDYLYRGTDAKVSQPRRRGQRWKNAARIGHR